MVEIKELRTVNIAVENWRESAERWRKLGLTHSDGHLVPTPPAQITDVAFRFEIGGFSLIEPSSPESTVSKFLAKRGPGIYSMAVRVDDIGAAMREWSAAGIEWIRDEPLVVEDSEVPPFHVERNLMNWIHPRSLGGVLLEVEEWQGKVTRMTEYPAPEVCVCGADGNQAGSS